jgi:hypothetical protein
MVDDDISLDDDSNDNDDAKSYLESTVTATIHDALLALNASRPEDPLQFLGEYVLRAASKAREDRMAKPESDTNTTNGSG